MNFSILYWVLLAVMAVGLVGSLLPALPGPTLILGSIVVWGVVTRFADFSWLIAIAFLALILSAAVEYLATFWGAKRLGASQWGIIGGFVGMFLGVFGLLPALPIGGPFIGLVFGPVIGAFIGEFIHRRDLELAPRAKLSLQVGFGIVVGTIVGKFLEFLLALTAVVIFLLETWPGTPVV